MLSPERLIEFGIGETRCAIVEGGEIAEARIGLEGIVPFGRIVHARLTDCGRSGCNAVAVADGEEYLLPEAPKGVAEGAQFDLKVTRERIPGGETWKRPLGRAATGAVDGNVTPDTSDATAALDRRLDEAGWDDLLEEARSGIVRFEGGELRVSVTPAMTLIDVDGHLPPLDLARAGADAAARAIRRHGIGGSIGIDFPTVRGKAGRQMIADAIDANLPQPFERTAVNGFGFLQIVRPRQRASLFELAQDRAPFEARALLRRAGKEIGAVRLAAHPAVTKVLEDHPAWLETLSRQIGGAVGLRADPLLPISGGHAEKA